MTYLWNIFYFSRITPLFRPHLDPFHLLHRKRKEILAGPFILRVFIHSKTLSEKEVYNKPYDAIIECIKMERHSRPFPK
jgi:hypothetical protein